MVAREELLERFRREVRSTRSLVHPRIVRVFDYREDLSQGLALFSMEYIEGASVAGLLASARARKDEVPVPLALSILAQVLEALAAAHEQGVIHRDVTPANILLAGGTAEELLAAPKGDPKVKLVDFGIAGALERSELSQKSRVLGTGPYVAPEVLDPDVEVTSAADVYGAGAVFYELLTQKMPQGRFPDPSQLREGLDPGIDRLALELLASEPERRPKARAGSEAVLYLQGEEERQKERERQPEEKRRAEETPLKQQAAGSTSQASEAGSLRPLPEPIRGTAYVSVPPPDLGSPAPTGFSVVGPDNPWYPKKIHDQQEAAANELGLPLVIQETKSGIVLVLVPAGSFLMGAIPGDSKAESGERPRHKVTLRAFYVGVAPVLQEQWERVREHSPWWRRVEKNPSRFKGDRHPVECVSWNDARRFLGQLDCGLRLPTEAEWEYAARGGTEGNRYPWGNSLSPSDANCRGGGTTPVGSYAANGFGLYDTAGNVWEWCGDWYDSNYYSYSPPQDPQGPLNGKFRVVRGGLRGRHRDLRVSDRDGLSPGDRDGEVGFRCALAPGPI